MSSVDRSTFARAFVYSFDKNDYALFSWFNTYSQTLTCLNQAMEVFHVGYADMGVYDGLGKRTKKKLKNAQISPAMNLTQLWHIRNTSWHDRPFAYYTLERTCTCTLNLAARPISPPQNECSHRVCQEWLGRVVLVCCACVITSLHKWCVHLYMSHTFMHPLPPLSPTLLEQKLLNIRMGTVRIRQSSPKISIQYTAHVIL